MLLWALVHLLVVGSAVGSGSGVQAVSELASSLAGDQASSLVGASGLHDPVVVTAAGRQARMKERDDPGALVSCPTRDMQLLYRFFGGARCAEKGAAHAYIHTCIGLYATCCGVTVSWSNHTVTVLANPPTPSRAHLAPNTHTRTHTV